MLIRLSNLEGWGELDTYKILDGKPDRITQELQEMIILKRMLNVVWCVN